MDRIWQWAWDRYGPRYSWAIYAGTVAVLMPVYLVLSFVVVAFESSGQYVESAFVTVVAVLVLAYVMILPGLGESRLYERWAAGQEVDRARALDATYAWTREAVAQGGGGQRCRNRLAIRCCRCDHRGNRVAVSPVRDHGRRFRNCRGGGRRA